MNDVAAAEQMYGRRGLTRAGGRVHAIRNGDFRDRAIARCAALVGVTVGQDQGVTCQLCVTLLGADRRLANLPYAERIIAAEAAITEAGFTLRYVDVCEDGDAPGLIGMGAGVTVWGIREVRIRKMLSGIHLAEVLEHELAHVQERPGYERGTHGLFGGSS